MGEKRVLLGAIIGAHGLKGEVRVKAFTDDPSSLGAYGMLVTDKDRELRVDQVSASKPGEAIVWFGGIRDRNAAEALKGTQLFVPRSVLPDPEPGAFYHADLVGLPAEDESGAPLGRVKAMHNFGAGDLIELEREDGKTEFFLFSDDTVPVVETGKRIVVRLPKDNDDDHDDAS